MQNLRAAKATRNRGSRSQDLDDLTDEALAARIGHVPCDQVQHIRGGTAAWVADETRRTAQRVAP